MKLLVVDDHPVFRDGLAALLKQAAEHTEVLQAPECATALSIVDAHDDIDAVFVDLTMPGMTGDMAVREFGKRRGERARAIGRERGDTQAPHLEIRVPVKRPLCAIEARDDRVGVLDQGLARRSEPRDPAHAHRERNARAALKGVDVVRHGRLAEPQGACGRGLRAMASHLAEDQQALDVDHQTMMASKS